MNETTCEAMDVWVVWNKTGRRPQFFHETREGAETEAARLALKHQGRKFIVLHMVSKFSAAQGGETRRAETSGSVHEHAVAASDAPKGN